MGLNVYIEPKNGTFRRNWIDLRIYVNRVAFHYFDPGTTILRISAIALVGDNPYILTLFFYQIRVNREH